MKNILIKNQINCVIIKIEEETYEKKIILAL